MQPAAERERPAPKTVAQRNPGDLYCGDCGEGNAAERRFCRRCGASLANIAPEPMPKVPWYRKLFGGGKPAAPAYHPPTVGPDGTVVPGAAGGGAAFDAGGKAKKWKSEKPRGISGGTRARNIFGKLGWPLAFLAILGVGISPLRVKITDWGFRTYHSLVPSYSAVHPESAKLISGPAQTDKDHGVSQFVDGFDNTAWVTKGSGVGATVRIEFSHPVNLDKIGFLNGSKTNYVDQSRPTRVEITLPDGTKKQFGLKDEAKFQAYDLKARGVTFITLKVLVIQKGLKNQNMALTEMEFKKRN
jgi:hypothetical protein